MTNNSDSYFSNKHFLLHFPFLVYEGWSSVYIGVFYVLHPLPVSLRSTLDLGNPVTFVAYVTVALCLENESWISSSNFQLPWCVGSLSFLKTSYAKIFKKSPLQLPAAAVLKCGSLTQRHRAVPGSPVGEDHCFLHFARKGAAPPGWGSQCPLPVPLPWGDCHLVMDVSLISVQPSLLRQVGVCATPHPDGASLRPRESSPL